MTEGGGSAFDVLARAFGDAYNRRDADGLAALCEPDVEFHPSLMVGRRATYLGHAGIRRWVEELAQAPIQARGRVTEVRPLGERRFMVIADMLEDGKLLLAISWAVRVGESGLIAEAYGHLGVADDAQIVRDQS